MSTTLTQDRSVALTPQDAAETGQVGVTVRFVIAEARWRDAVESVAKALAEDHKWSGLIYTDFHTMTAAELLENEQLTKAARLHHTSLAGPQL